MKGLWIQLPVPDFNFYYLDSNVSLAAGLILLKNRNFLRDRKIFIEVLSQEIASLASDRYLIDYILDGGYQILFFTSYMWNVERNIYIAREIKKLKRDVRIIFGGPEISVDSPWMDVDCVDTFFVGEGEENFNLLFEESVSRIIFGKFSDISSLKVDPYSSGIIPPGLGENYPIETMRGCPYSCKYCFYSKNRSRVRFYGKDLMEDFFQFINSKKNVSEIYFLDPSFEVHPHLIDFLKFISHLNPLKIPIHTEIRPERIDEETGKWMRNAGFKSVELGLQSTSQKVLDFISRKTDLDKFLRGTEILLKNGIEPQIGIIIGLPFDNLDSFSHTVKWLNNKNLGLNSEAFILSLLPQTELREIAIRENYSFMKYPPYYILKNNFLDTGDIYHCIKILENEFNIEYYPFEVPNIFKDGEGEFIGNIYISSFTDNHLLSTEIFNHLSSTLTVEVAEMKSGKRERLLNFLRKIIDENPFILLNIVFYEFADIDEVFLKSLLELAKEDNYYSRLNFYRDDYTFKFTIRLHLSGDYEFFKKNYNILPYFSSLICRWDGSEDLIELGEKMLSFENYIFIEPAGFIDEGNLKEIRKLIPHYFDDILFSDGKVLRKWESLFGLEKGKILKKLRSIKL